MFVYLLGSGLGIYGKNSTCLLCKMELFMYSVHGERSISQLVKLNSYLFKIQFYMSYKTCHMFVIINSKCLLGMVLESCNPST